MRGYKMVLDHEESDLKAQIRKEMIGKLAQEWNQIHSYMERQSFRDEEDDAEYQEFHGEAADDYAYAALEHHPNLTNLSKEEKEEVLKVGREQYWEQVRAEENKPYLRMEVIEELLSELGARMMRPYEHHNELEGYYEYMENRYPERS